MGGPFHKRCPFQHLLREVRLWTEIGADVAEHHHAGPGGFVLVLLTVSDQGHDVFEIGHDRSVDLVGEQAGQAGGCEARQVGEVPQLLRSGWQPQPQDRGSVVRAADVQVALLLERMPDHSQRSWKPQL